MDVRIIRSDRRSMSLQIKNAQVIARVPKRTSEAQIRRFIENNMGWIETHLARAIEKERVLSAIAPLSEEELDALVREAKRVIPERVAHYAALMGVSYGRITIRKQRSRWGSCSASGNLNFNCLLILAPSEALDSVVVHELCHRREMNHSSRFYREVYRVFPEYDRWHSWLDANGEALMRRLGK